MQHAASGALQHDDAVGVARRLVSGEFTAVALMQSCLQRIAARDGELGAVCRLEPDLGFAGARAIDAEVAAVAGRADAQRVLLERRPFCGVPLLLKDLSTAAVDVPSGMGSKLFGQLAGGPVQWESDSTLVARYREAGFIPFGRTATPELGISATTEVRAYGRPTRNPWDLRRSAGGSSGGAGAAVAARLVPIAHATDGAGSIRIPASCCGLVGLKPSRALMPTGPQQGEGWGGFATEHVLTHTVRDCALALAVSAGSSPGSAYLSPPIDRAGLRRLALAAQGAGGAAGALALAPAGALRIGLIDTRFDGGAVDADVREAVLQTAATLARIGHQVTPLRLPVATEDIVDTVIRTMAAWTAAGIEAFCEINGLDPNRLPEDALEPATRGAWALGRGMSSGAYIELQRRANRISRALAAAMAAVDIVLMPTLAEPPALIGRFEMNNPDYLDYRLGPSGLIHYSPFTPLANLTGQPAVSLPSGMAGGLPVGIQLVGRLGEDLELLQLAAALEVAMPWYERRAPEHPAAANAGL